MQRELSFNFRNVSSSSKFATATSLTTAFRRSPDSNLPPRRFRFWRARRLRRRRRCSAPATQRTCPRWRSTPRPRRTPTPWSSHTRTAVTVTATPHRKSVTKAWRVTIVMRLACPCFINLRFVVKSLLSVQVVYFKSYRIWPTTVSIIQQLLYLLG